MLSGQWPHTFLPSLPDPKASPFRGWCFGPSFGSQMLLAICLADSYHRKSANLVKKAVLDILKTLVGAAIIGNTTILWRFNERLARLETFITYEKISHASTPAVPGNGANYHHPGMFFID